MAHDLLFPDSDVDWSMNPGARAKAARERALPLDFTQVERKTLKMLEPSTAAFAVELVGWAGATGLRRSCPTPRSTRPRKAPPTTRAGDRASSLGDSTGTTWAAPSTSCYRRSEAENPIVSSMPWSGRKLASSAASGSGTSRFGLSRGCCSTRPISSIIRG